MKKEIIKMALHKLGVGSNMPDMTVSDKKKMIKEMKIKIDLKNLGVGSNMPSF